MTDPINKLETQLAALEADPQADLWQKIDTLNELAWKLREIDRQRSLSLSQIAFNLARTADSPYQKGIAYSLRNLSYLSLYLANYEQVLPQAFEALALFEAIDEPAGQPDIYGVIGEAYLGMADYSQALHCFQQAWAKANQLGNKFIEAYALRDIGRVYSQQQQWEQAHSYLQQALSLAEAIGAKLLRCQCHQILAELYKKQEDYEQALAHYEQFHTLEREIFSEQATHKLKRLQVIHQTETAKKEAELNRRRNIELEQEISDRKRAKAEAQQAKEATEAANQAKSEFLAQMSHELRTPLNAILGYTQILKRDNTLTPRQMEGLETIHQNGDHLLTLINDILDFSKIEARKLELSPTQVNLPDFLSGLTSIINFRAEQKGLTFTYEVLTGLPTVVQADETRLRQVLLNLLSNAIKFTDKGQVTFRIWTQSMDAKRGRRAGNTKKRNEMPLPATTYALLHFEVSDTGIGIHPKQLEKIFQLFEQGGKARRRTEGTGLGLAISRHLVQMMGSDLQVQSEPERGSIFWFELTLPVITPALLAAGVVERNISEEKKVVNITQLNSAATGLIPPPVEELTVLHELAMLGKMGRIRQQAEYLADLDKRYQPFAYKLQELAKGFEIERLQTFLKQYMEINQ